MRTAPLAFSFLPLHGEIWQWEIIYRVNALSGLYLISTNQALLRGCLAGWSVSMPSRASTSFDTIRHFSHICSHSVDGAWYVCWRASTSFLRYSNYEYPNWRAFVSMPSRASTSFLLIDIPFPAVDPLATCQCPLGLVPHFYFLRGGSITNSFFMCVNALSG